MSKTNIGLVDHCERALKEKWYYLWGASAQLATLDYINSNIRQYPENERWRSYVTQAIGKTRVCDCYGLVKSYLWWKDDNSNPGYDAKQDMNTTAAYNRAIEKNVLLTLPEIPGIVLWMKGHVGVYIGGGRFIECAGGGKGMVEGQLIGGKVIRGSKFTHWFKDLNIEYLNQSPITSDVQTPEKPKQEDKTPIPTPETAKKKYEVVKTSDDHTLISRENLAKLIEFGIIQSPNYWLNLKVDYINALIDNASPRLNKDIDNKIKDLDSALRLLVKKNILKSPVYWVDKCKTIRNLDLLLINLAIKIE